MFKDRRLKLNIQRRRYRRNAGKKLPTFPKPDIHYWTDEEIHTSKPYQFRGKAPLGYIIYDGPSLYDGEPIIVIATGFTASKNPKTGFMIQTYILRQDMHPMNALRSGADKSICGRCSHRGRLGACRSCYVNLQSVGEVYKAYLGGSYIKVDQDDIANIFKYARHPPRLGSYGDPAMVPLRIWKEVTRHRSNWTGYTSQWRIKRSQPYKLYLQASTNSYEDYHHAKELGWDSFRVGRKDEPKLETEVYCPQTPEGGGLLLCSGCTLCMGTSRASKDILTRPHGKGRRYHEEREHHSSTLRRRHHLRRRNPDDRLRRLS